jgi:flagellar biosynthesis/type III secretory pathway chaperone
MKKRKTRVSEFFAPEQEGLPSVMDKQLAFLFQFLIDALKDELESFARLLDVIREETQALRDNKLPEVIDIGIRKGNAFRQSEAAVQRRVDAVIKINAYLSIEDSLPFVELAPYTDAATRQILTGYRDRFADIVHRIKSANETNRQIIALTLAQVSNNIKFIRNMTASLPNYDRHGQISARSLQGEVISRAG